jgi:hypothetical protein
MPREEIRIANDKELYATAYNFLDGCLSYFAFSKPLQESNEMLRRSYALGEAASRYISIRFAESDEISYSLFYAAEKVEQGYRILRFIDGNALNADGVIFTSDKDFYPDPAHNLF